jgi:hypothetical protein
MHYWFPILLTVVANIAYHMALKWTPQQISPWFFLTAAYTTAGITTGLLCLFSWLAPGGNQGPSGSNFGGVLLETARDQWRHLNWSAMALGIGIVLLEYGFMLAYRAGWKISTAGVVSNIMVGLLLIPVGYCFFAEILGLRQFFGVIFALMGLYLISAR